MAKRFTDTNKYKKPFIRGLEGAYKLLWDYLYHDCDHAGIWIVDFEIAQLYIGQDMQVSKTRALAEFNSDEQRIVEFDGGKKWFIPSFITFQYGELNEQNRAHNSVISLLSKNNLLKVYKEHISPLQGAKDKDKERDMVMDMETYVCPKIYLKNKIEIDLEQMNQKSGMSEDEFDFCITQWSLKSVEKGWEYSGNDEKDLKQLRAGFEKWLGSWMQNLRNKNNNNGKTTHKKGQPDTENIVGAAYEALRQHNLKNNTGGN